ncbi:PrsW family intramembrane metalloprotease [Antrihabitans sp. YC2-6]|uniref:PrsW family intramembrane metalloprotease n=1 Tax=Antrihabitans sp. YC2-6 TaxID=2799498 RepID=UPI0018F58E8A|nr:PrsW family glutamic-type intramembrane protease [Antrihabitans sp. YC2-6]MBJ8344719.1 PrsW family intramembrane metalloprotease [Antrihabitans sp. YC2-6]
MSAEVGASKIDLAALDEARRNAVKESGWGTPFTIVQPRNAAFWVFAWGMVVGTVVLLQTFVPTVGAYGIALGAGIVLFGIYTIPWLILLHHHNRYTSLPGKMLLFAFLWGAIPATFWMGLQANGAILGLYSKLFGNAWAGDWGPGFTAPFSEETAKACALILLLGLAPRLVRSAYDGLIIGAYAGLGLQISEDILYANNAGASRFGQDQISAAIGIFVGRGSAGLFQHVLFSALMGAAIMWVIGRDGGGHRLRGLVLMAFTLVLHGSWDVFGALGNSVFGTPAGGYLVMLILAVVGSTVLVWCLRKAAVQEMSWLRDLLAPEVARGVITERELSAITGGRKQRKQYLKATKGGPPKHILGATMDLAEELARAGGADSERVEYARSELARLHTAG